MKYALVYDEVDTCRITVMVVKKTLGLCHVLKLFISILSRLCNVNQRKYSTLKFR